MELNVEKKKISVPYEKRIKWFKQSRFGMFVHWGLYSILGRHEWVMNRERIPISEYEKLADVWSPIDRPARLWAALAKDAGMKYMVFTSKHHEGYSLWDSQVNSYNSVKRGPGRDFVEEYVAACREYGLKIGIYYSLSDWHNPDCALAAKDEKSRIRFIDYTHSLVEELCTNYGKIDIMWYDGPFPVCKPEFWESEKLNSMVRQYQPQILINDRSMADEDFGTPEENVMPGSNGKMWEACMTFNGEHIWGYAPNMPDKINIRDIIKMLRKASAYEGNLLLNIGPKPDGTIVEYERATLATVGKWLKDNGEAVYGDVEHIEPNLERQLLTGMWTLKGNNAYYWSHYWLGKEIVIAGMISELQRASFLSTNEEIEFVQNGEKIILKNLPEENPDSLAGYCVIKLEFRNKPNQVLTQMYCTPR